jgi:hypothetical protein
VSLTGRAAAAPIPTPGTNNPSDAMSTTTTSSVRPGDLSEQAFLGDLSELGWQGRFKHDDDEVVRLREQLAAQAGIPQLEVVDPAEPGFAQRAKALLSRDG